MSKKELSGELRRILLKRGMTQRDLAEELGFIRGSLSVWITKGQWPKSALKQIVAWIGPPLKFENLHEKFVFSISRMQRSLKAPVVRFADAVRVTFPFFHLILSSGYWGELTQEDLVYLYRVGDGLKQRLSPGVVKELLKLRHRSSA